MTAKALSWTLRALAMLAAFHIFIPDAARALLLGFTQVGLAGGGLDVVYPDAARAFGVGRLLFFIAALACILGMEKRRGFFIWETSRMPALYDFPKRAAGGFCIAGVFGYSLGMMLHFFEEWSAGSLVFAVMLGGILSFHVLGALTTDGASADMEKMQLELELEGV